MKNTFHILKESYQTSKTHVLATHPTNKWLVFKVDMTANKYDIRKAVQDLFPDLPIYKIHVINKKTTGDRKKGPISKGRPSFARGFKKAYISIRPGTDVKKLLEGNL